MLEHGVRSSNVSSFWSWPLSKLPMSQDLLQANDRFVEDRSYKLLIVDSIMNLFRKSATKDLET